MVPLDLSVTTAVSVFSALQHAVYPRTDEADPTCGRCPKRSTSRDLSS